MILRNKENTHCQFSSVFMDGLNQSLGLYVIEAEKIIITENRTKGRDKERALNVLQKNPGELLLKILKEITKVRTLEFYVCYNS